MSTWGDSVLLVELIDRQFEYLQTLGGTDQIVRLRRILRFLTGDPLPAAILEDLRIEATQTNEALNHAAELLRADLRLLWEQHAQTVRAKLASVTDDAINAYGPMASYEQSLQKDETIDVTSTDSFHGLELLRRVKAFAHWKKWVTDRAEREGTDDGGLANISDALNLLRARATYMERGIEEGRRSLAWSAYKRLLRHSNAFNPEPPRLDVDDAWIRYSMATDFAETLRKADEVEVSAVEEMDVDFIYSEIKNDSKLLHEELRLRIGLARSRLALVRRYAARCAGFEALRLRRECQSDPANAERTLTLDFARFLFDAGIPPLIDPTVTGLRPDVLHVDPASSFYAEAKQYDDPHPTSQLRRAYAQVWSTWGSLRNTYDVTECFLVVFRRSGPWAELPPVIRHEGLKLFSIVADISEARGSREPGRPIHLSADELKPTALTDVLQPAAAVATPAPNAPASPPPGPAGNRRRSRRRNT